MKHSIAFLFFVLVTFGAMAQSISVKSFKALPMDMTASSLEGKRIDQNGDVAALIKVVTSETNFTFEGGTLGIVDTKQTPGEVWVWVPRAARKITIKHPKLGVLRDYYYPMEIEAERTYEMILTTAKIETIIKEEVRQQYLIFELEPKNATLEVNDQLWSVGADGTALQFVDFGTYTYRVRAANYETDAGVVTVDDPDPDNPKIVKVKLKSNFAEVTFTVDADAEIWVNNEKKGTRTCTGSLGKGSYKIECKQEGHETSMVSKEITTEMNGQTVTLPAPRPIYGSLNVESMPIGATIYIDGKEIGKTPRYINEFLVGQHELRLSKEGYKDYVETVVAAKGQRKEVKATLIADGSSTTYYTISVSANPDEGGTVRGGGTFSQGQSCTVTATANSGYTFRNWTENGSVVSARCSNTFTVNSNRTVKANFDFAYSIGGHVYVDLGLPSGTLWATCNVGATNPEDYGDYFAWGETQPKSDYSSSNYQYWNGSYNTLTKYCNNASYGYNGFTDNLTTLQPSDDAATAQWGSGWRMPTKEEWQELLNNTTNVWTTQNGVKGRLFTASNGNSLFLPAAGYYDGTGLYDAGSYGIYWSSSLYTDSPYYAWDLLFDSGNCGVDVGYRFDGFTVRPVRSSRQN